jgi:hypothetical protein
MEFCMANFEVVFWSCEVDERMEAQYDRLVKACPSLRKNPDHPKFARHWCDMSIAINPMTRKADIALKRLSRLFDNTRALDPPMRTTIILFSLNHSGGYAF